MMIFNNLKNSFLSAATFLALAGTAVPVQAAPVQNIVLVHGAFVDGSGWQPVYDILVKDGYNVTVVQQPLTSLEEDIAATKRILDRQPGPCILVGHSYGGAVITEAGTDSHVAALVYIAAHAPEEGETEAANGKKFPNASKPLVKTPDGFVFLDPANFPERIPERIVHAKGSAAHGTLKITNDITRYSKAAVFSKVGKEVPAYLRFSTVAGERGAADAERDVRGFALRFYTEEGNWDLVGNNTPVFFVRDPLKFPDFIHTQKRDPKTNMRSNAAAWDFWSLSPESLHQVTILMSDRGLPRSYRQMNGYGSHTYSFINAKSERYWVKFHFKSMQGHSFYTDQEAAEVAGSDRESAQRDLFENIEGGNYPRWRFCVQVMPEDEAETYRWNPFDLTKVWPHSDYPLIEVGILELNRNPENYFAEVEQAAFSPANIVPGIGHSPDKMLQARIFSYADAHRYRLGVNHDLIPVNKPRCPVMNYHRDGFMRVDANGGGSVNYEPNSLNGPVQQAAFDETPLRITGDVTRYDHRDGNDDYTQAGNLFRLMNPEQRERLFGNIARHMQAGNTPQEIQLRQICHFFRADPAYGIGVAQVLGIDLAEFMPNGAVQLEAVAEKQ